jgi:hypothetical protein
MRLFRVSAATGTAEPFTARPSYYGQFAGTRVIFNGKEPDGVMKQICEGAANARKLLGGIE